MEKSKTLEGVITSKKMNKTLVVSVTRTLRHKKYSKVIKLNKKVYAHTESDDHEVGDIVTIIETRPLSKLKRWRVANIGNKTTA